MARKRKIGLGLIAIFVAIYLMSFLCLRYWYLPVYEWTHLLNKHPLRPAYAVAYYPLRLLASQNWSLVSKEPESTVGKIRKLEHNRIELNLGDSSATSIGFVCEPSACAQLDTVGLGDLVEAQFGAALVPDSDTLVNKLLSIRKCQAQDPTCSAKLEEQHRKALEMQAKFEAIEKKYTECMAAMERTFLADPRYIGSDKIIAQSGPFIEYSMLSGKRKYCVDTVLEADRQALLDSCLMHHCGDGIGGGCWHIVGHLGKSGTLSQALQKCAPE